MAGRISPDPVSVGMIVLANAFALALARAEGWSLFDLLIPYWIQNVVIGWYTARRMMLLPRFTASGVRYDETVPLDEPTRKLVAAGLPTPERFAKRVRVKFFAAHYGFFHFGYLLFFLMWLQAGRPIAGIALPSMSLRHGLELGLATLAFVLAHRASFKRNLEHDLQGRPNLDAVMFLPYARILPMHATIVFGLALAEGQAVLLFGSLKAVADVVMHWAEHSVLGRSRG